MPWQNQLQLEATYKDDPTAELFVETFKWRTFLRAAVMLSDPFPH
ncbi:MAG: hypothetical protein ABIF09_02435 [Gemmatimonadota bacterium]